MKRLLVLGILVLMNACSGLSSEEPVRDFTYYLEHDGLRRHYDVHVPPVYAPDRPAAVVIYLHGGGGGPDSAQHEGLFDTSDGNGFLLVSPAGTGPDAANRLLTWNAGKWGSDSCCGYAAEKNIDDVGFLTAVIADVQARYTVDPRHIYLAGFSNGGMMAYRMACERAELIAAVAVVASPAVPDGCAPSQPVPILHIHGTLDPCAPYEGGPGGDCARSSQHFTAQSVLIMMDTWVGLNGCALDPVETYAKGSAVCLAFKPCNGVAEVSLCSVEGAGHAWPNGRQYLPIERIGPVPKDIGNRQIWEFFSRFIRE